MGLFLGLLLVAVLFFGLGFIVKALWVAALVFALCGLLQFTLGRD